MYVYYGIVLICVNYYVQFSACYIMLCFINFVLSTLGPTRVVKLIIQT